MKGLLIGKDGLLKLRLGINVLGNRLEVLLVSHGRLEELLSGSVIHFFGEVGPVIVRTQVVS